MWSQLAAQICHFFGSQCRVQFFATKSVVFQRFATKQCYTLLMLTKTVLNSVNADKTVFYTVNAFYNCIEPC